jgi:hypothetical protein
MGRCPCPRCTVKKVDFAALGTTIDSDSRRLQVRRDNDLFRATVQTARDNIYRGGYALGSEPGVEQFLKEESLVPTLVCHSILGAFMNLISTPERVLPLTQKLPV